jgi:hypothetical protein
MAILRYQQYDLATATASAVTYVKSQQLGDGSFGFGGPGIPYATALGALGLMRSEHCSFSTNTERAINALLAMQAANGSWSNQPYDTSLAMLALTEHGNDSDGDGVKDDGDCSGAVEDHPCPNGVTSACDDNCTVVANPGQQNADNDRRGDACDRSNSNAQAWSTPSDVALSLFHYPEFGRTEVNWGAAADNGGSVAAVYDTLRSNDPSSFQAPAICVESNQPDTMSTDFDMPASGVSFFFLVRVVNGCPGPGNMGTNSSGVPRTGRSCP